MQRTFAWTALSSATLAAMALFSTVPAGAVSITEFPGVLAGTGPNVITLGPDGALWYTEFGSSKIGRITTAGVVTEFATPPNSTPYGITTGADGALWISDQVSPKIRRMTTAGVVTEFPIPSGNTTSGITRGPDGNIWFTEQTTASIGRITPAGVILELPISAGSTGPAPYMGYSLVTSANGAPTTIVAGPDGLMWFTEKNGAKVARLNADTSSTEFAISGPAIGITAGPDGALWFVEEGANKIGRVTTAGMVTEFAVPTPGSLPFGIASGPDGALWFAEFGAGKIGRITTTGAISEFPVPSPNSSVYTIVNGPDQALWFTESDANRIGRLDPAASPSPLVSAVLPTSRSVQVGSTATVFATLINSAGTPATGCHIVPITPVAANFSYQATNSATNAPIGSANTPVDVGAGAAQSFVISFATAAAFAPTDTALGFSCTGVPAASNNVGLNTLLLSASPSPVPDVVALAATLSSDGILSVPGVAGSNAFAVATVNVGAGGAITAVADTGPVLLPVAISLCQTNPASGKCISAVGPSVTTTINANETPTFAIFATASGAIPFAPASNRIFVHLKDAGGVVRGSTSVALRTQ
ncbi:MAG: putative antibiotic hydrolase [Rhodospirillales bacterium]|nr:putative antibiotic hydrolase [Rhodospirillales bacterium]